VQTNEQEHISLNIIMRLWFHKTSHYMQLMQLSVSLHSLSLHLNTPPAQCFAQHPQSQDFFLTILWSHIKVTKLKLLCKYVLAHAQTVGGFWQFML